MTIFIELIYMKSYITYQSEITIIFPAKTGNSYINTLFVSSIIEGVGVGAVLFSFRVLFSLFSNCAHIVGGSS